MSEATTIETTGTPAAAAQSATQTNAAAEPVNPQEKMLADFKAKRAAAKAEAKKGKESGSATEPASASQTSPAEDDTSSSTTSETEETKETGAEEETPDKARLRKQMVQLASGQAKLRAEQAAFQKAQSEHQEALSLAKGTKEAIGKITSGDVVGGLRSILPKDVDLLAAAWQIIESSDTDDKPVTMSKAREIFQQEQEAREAARKKAEEDAVTAKRTEYETRMAAYVDNVGEVLNRTPDRWPTIADLEWGLPAEVVAETFRKAETALSEEEVLDVIESQLKAKRSKASDPKPETVPGKSVTPDWKRGGAGTTEASSSSDEKKGLTKEQRDQARRDRLRAMKQVRV